MNSAASGYRVPRLLIEPRRREHQVIRYGVVTTPS